VRIRNKIFLSALTVVYGLSVLLLHDFFVQISIRLMNHFSLPLYNKLVRNVFLFVGLIFAGACLWKSLQNKRYVLLIFFMVFLVLLLLHAAFLFEMNVEIIHAVEYGILGVLFYRLCSNAGWSVALSLPFMLLDEWIQYSFLYKNYNQYYEFNDLVLNVLGIGIFVLFIKIFEEPRKEVSTALWKRKEFLFILLIFSVFIILVAGCVFAVHQNVACSNTVFVLSKINFPESFWHIHFFTGAKYHILSPVWGAIIMFLLCTGICLFDYPFYSMTANGSPSKTI
jgi:hypothetical protein